MRVRFIALAILVFALGTAQRATATPIIVNGGFEAGLTGWTATPGGVSLFGVGPILPHSGANAAFFGGVNFGGGDEDHIAQTFATTAGQSYLVRFWLEMDITSCGRNCNNHDFSAFWNSTPILYTSGGSAFGYTEYTYSLLATGATSTLMFAGANEPGYYRLDDVSVSEVPEPASLILIGSGLGWTFLRRRTARRS